MFTKRRLTTYPIVNTTAWDYYKTAASLYWTPEEITLTTDIVHMRTKLNPSMKQLVLVTQGLFASFDTLVNISNELVASHFNDLEIKYFYDFQIMMENIHGEMYSIILWELVESVEERDALFKVIENMPTVAAMGDFMRKYIENDTYTIGERLLSQACVEGIFFTGSFCIIYWLQSMGLLPGVAHANEFIARDEALHTAFAIYAMKLKDAISTSRAHAIVNEAVTLAIQFMESIMGDDMVDMNIKKMSNYIRHVGDNLLDMAGFPALYRNGHEFRFMDQINLMNRTHFFEKRVSEYSRQTSASAGEPRFDF